MDHGSVSLHGKRFHIPNFLRVLVDAPIAREEAHACHRRDALGDPFILVSIRVIHETVRLNVAVEVIRHQVIISVVADRAYHGSKVMRCAERALFNLVEYLVQVWVDAVRSVRVGVAEIFDVFGEIAKEKDVALADFTGDFNLGTCQMAAALTQT